MQPAETAAQFPSAPSWISDPIARWSERKLLAIVTAAALALRLYLTFTSYCISGDGIAYIAIARNFASGQTAKALASVFPPLYPWMIALVHSLVPNWEVAGQLISATLGSGAVVAIYLLTREVFGRRDIAAGAAILATIHPDIAQYAASVRTEAGYLTMVLCAAWLMLAGVRKRRLGLFALCGLVLGIAYWYRTEAIGVPVLGAGFLLFGAFIWREWEFRWAVAAVALMLGVFAIMASPLLIYLNHTSDHWIVSRELKAAVMYGMSDAAGGSNDWQLLGYSSHSSMWTLIAAAPWLYLGKIARDLLWSPYFYADALGPLLTVFLAIGVFTRGREILRNYREAYLVALTIFYVVGFAASYTGFRFMLHLVPFAFGWVMVGIERASSWVASLNFGGWRVPASSVLVLVALAILPRTLLPIGYDQRALRDAGEEIAERGRDQATVISRDKRTAFYAGAHDVYLPIDPKPDLCGWLAGQPRPSYLMLADREEHQLNIDHSTPCLAIVRRYTRPYGYYDLFAVRD